MVKNVRSLPPGPASRHVPMLDDVDRDIIAALVDDGRMSNAMLTRRVGIAESTCSGRVRSLHQRGVIAGIHAVVDPAAVGVPVQAMVAVQFGGHERAQVEQFQSEVSCLPGVLSAIRVSGSNDFSSTSQQPRRTHCVTSSSTN